MKTKKKKLPESLNNGWNENNLFSNHKHNILKTFKFKAQESLSSFILELLQFEHEPSLDSPHIEATETACQLTIEVSIELGSCTDSNHIHKFMKKVDDLFEECSNDGK